MDNAEIEAQIQEIKSLVATLAAGRGVEGNANGLDFVGVEMDGGDLPLVPIGGSGGMFDWDGEKKQIKAGRVMVGRKMVPVEASSEQLGDHEWGLSVTLSGSGETVEFCQLDNGPSNTDTVTYLPLYKIRDGKIEEDWRGCFTVQCWE